MELRHLRYFTAVAEKLNFTEAARSLHIAQPSLSQQIQDLEREVGVSLIARNNRNVKLTPAGEQFYREAVIVLEHADSAIKNAQRASRGEIGELRASFLIPAVRSFLPKVIRQYRQIFPNVSLHFSHLSPVEQLAALDEGRLDIGIMRAYNQKAYPHLLATTIYRDTLLAVVPPDHPFAQQSCLRLEQLEGQPIIVFGRALAPTFFDTVMQFCGDVSPQVVSQDPYLMETVLMLSEAGMGIGIVPGCLADFRQTNLKFLPFTPQPPQVDLLLVRRQDGLGNPLVDEFVRLVQSTVSVAPLAMAS